MKITEKLELKKLFEATLIGIIALGAISLAFSGEQLKSHYREIYREALIWKKVISLCRILEKDSSFFVAIYRCATRKEKISLRKLTPKRLEKVKEVRRAKELQLKKQKRLKRRSF